MLAIFTIFTMASSVASTAEPIDISAAVRAHVVADTGNDDVEIDEVGFQAAHSCAGIPEIRVESMPGEKYRGQTQFKVRLVENGVLCGRFSVPARVTIWKQVPVAATETRTGEPIHSEMARVATQDIQGVLIDLGSGEWVASRTLRAGQPITARYAKRKPAAATGDPVAIVAHYGALTVKAEGRMLTNGHLGERVRVANLATDTVVQGKLIAPGVVQTGGRR